MTKFIYGELPITDEEKPVLYTILIGNRHYTHKGKKLKDSLERFLEDVFRGMRGKSCPEYYSKVVEYCSQYPAINKVQVSLILNADAHKILAKEKAWLNQAKVDVASLNRTDLQPYKPEWMIKQSLQERCDNPITEGIVGGKKMKFKFCPNCGRLNK